MFDLNTYKYIKYISVIYRERVEYTTQLIVNSIRMVSHVLSEREGSGGGRRGKSKGRRPHLDDIGDEPYQVRQQEVGK